MLDSRVEIIKTLRAPRWCCGLWWRAWTMSDCVARQRPESIPPSATSGPLLQGMPSPGPVGSVLA
jgi:hypothetical protein